MVTGDWQQAMRAIRAVLSADCSCDEGDLLREGVVITVAEETPGRRRFLLGAKPLLIVALGRGVVAPCDAGRERWLRTTLGRLDRDAIFAAPVIAQLSRRLKADGQWLAGPELKYACSLDSFRPPAGRDGLSLVIVEEAEVTKLHQYEGFPHALSYRPDHPRRDAIATVARQAGDIVGVAAASADHDLLWQIGVDVAEVARGRGVGRALVGRLTEALLRSGKLPCYSTTASNIRSQALAISLGYRPAWTELYAASQQ